MRGQLQLIAERFTPLSSDIPLQTNFGCMFRIISSQPEAVLLPSLVKKLMPGETERTSWVGSSRIQMKKKMGLNSWGFVHAKYVYNLNCSPGKGTLS